MPVEWVSKDQTGGVLELTENGVESRQWSGVNQEIREDGV